MKPAIDNRHGKTDTAIATWFVADNRETGTYFPQIGGNSGTEAATNIYMRCVACFFITSLAVNPNNPHIFFTNSGASTAIERDVVGLLQKLGVQVVNLPITHRLRKGAVDSWGNQFYILDILKYIGGNSTFSKYVVLDSDCVWVKSVREISDAIDKFGVLTYLLDEIAYSSNQSINGLTRSELAGFLDAAAGIRRDQIPYFGGEIFAGDAHQISILSERATTIWQFMQKGVANAPKEEAHFLSILYAMMNYQSGTANPFVKRMWTTFKHNNIEERDLALSIWHLPSEKKTGFWRLYDKLVEREGGANGAPSEDLLSVMALARIMGVPRRGALKFTLDASSKVRERLFGSG